MFLFKLNENFVKFYFWKISTKSTRIPFCGEVYDYVWIHLVIVLLLLSFGCGITTKMIAMEAKNPKHSHIRSVKQFGVADWKHVFCVNAKIHLYIQFSNI